VSRAAIPHRTDPNSEDQRTVRHRFRVRSLLLLIFGLLTLISIAAITWNALHVYDHYRQAGHLAGANAVGQRSLTLNVFLARERGLTAALLANPEAMAEQSREALNRLRAQSDRGLASLQEQAAIYAWLPTVRDVKGRVGSLPTRLERMREQVDLSLSRGRVGYRYSEWIEAITSLIDEIAAINRAVTAPVDEADHAILYGSAVKEAFFNLSENAGRERALISAVIAQNRPFSELEYEELANFQYTRRMIERQISDIVHFFPRTPEIEQARAVPRGAGEHVQGRGHGHSVEGHAFQQALVAGHGYAVRVEYRPDDPMLMPAVRDVLNAVRPGVQGGLKAGQILHMAAHREPEAVCRVADGHGRGLVEQGPGSGQGARLKGDLDARRAQVG